MPTMIAGLFALYLLLAAIKQFAKLSPADAAKIVRKGGFAIGVIGVLLLVLRGGAGIFGALASAALGAATKGGFNPLNSAFQAAGMGAKKRLVSKARSATIEMRLDLDSGVVKGTVLGGPYGGKELDELARPDCLRLYELCQRDDPEGATLLETYFDRRFAGWREADEGQSQARGSARSSSAMSRDEAYEILGLPKGASAEEIIRSHRGLMKKLHPDHGGSTALAARVNQAKDVLLSRHG